MKYTTRMIGTVVAFCMAVPVFAQQYKATIPYRMVGEKMIIEMKVNGTARPFIFDTGGRTALTTQACQALQMAATDSAKVTDVNNVESYYKTTRIENLTTPDHVINFKNAPSLVIDEVKGWECFGVDGIIGSDLFANTIVTIDSQAKNIIVTSAEKPSTVSLRKMLNFTKGGGMPIVSIQMYYLILVVPACYHLSKVILKKSNRKPLWKWFPKGMEKGVSEYPARRTKLLLTGFVFHCYQSEPPNSVT